MNSFKHVIWVYVAILIYGLIFLLPFIGSVHLFDWDEIIFAESAREMLQTGDFMTVNINYTPFWEKPPLFFWLQALSMKIFGINEFAARFPNMICGILTLMAIFRIGNKVVSKRFGIIWVVSFATAILPFFYFKSGIIDPWHNLFILLGFAYFIYYLDPGNHKRRYIKLVLSAFFFGMAILTKGPVSVLIFGMSFFIFLTIKRMKISISFWHVLTFLIVLLVTGGSWYLLQILNGNIEVLKEFIRYQATLFSQDYAGHGGFMGYHFIILFFGVFPGSILFLTSFTKKVEDNDLQQMFRKWMYILFFLVLILFSVVKTKLMHYSSLAYFPVTYLAAWVWDKWNNRKIEIKTWQLILISFIALLYSVLAIALPIYGVKPKWIPSLGFSKFPNFLNNALNADITWTGFEFLIGVFLIAGVIYSIRMIRKREAKGMLILHIVTLLFVTSMVYIYTPKIESVTQNSAIEFIKEHAEKNAYITTLGYRSYATHFYGGIAPDMVPENDDIDELLNSSHQTDIYILMKVDDKQKYLAKYPKLEFLYEKNGYAFSILPKVIPDEGIE